MTTIILSTLEYSQAQLDKLQAVSPHVEVRQIPEAMPDDLPESLRNRVEVLYGWGDPVAAGHRYPNLKWVQTHSAGVNFLHSTPLWDSDVLITSVNGIHATPISEYVLAAMLAFRWKIRTMVEHQARAEWTKDRWEVYAGPELRDHTVGIIGYGAIGRELGRLTSALKMRVLAVNRSGRRSLQRGYTEPGIGDPDASIPEAVFRTTDLPVVLPQCDYVVVLAPLTPETRHLINAERLVQMKSSAILISVARGPLVDEAALVTALQQDTIAGAALDVFEEEPLPSNSPLWQLNNVILSPHVAGFSFKYDERASDLFAENIRRYLTGAPLLNLVDRERGY